jgi:hypothetical protein
LEQDKEDQKTFIQNGSDILTKTTIDQMGKDRLPNGNYILTVGQHYVLVVDGDYVETALISMSASQGKVSKKWNSMMLSITLNGANGPLHTCFIQSYV